MCIRCRDTGPTFEEPTAQWGTRRPVPDVRGGQPNTSSKDGSAFKEVIWSTGGAGREESLRIHPRSRLKELSS